MQLTSGSVLPVGPISERHLSGACMNQGDQIRRFKETLRRKALALENEHQAKVSKGESGRKRPLSAAPRPSESTKPPIFEGCIGDVAEVCWAWNALWSALTL